MRRHAQGVLPLLPALAIGLRSAQAGADQVRADPPAGWTSDSPPPHPSLVAAFRHPSGARAVVGVEFVRAGATVDAFAQGNLAALARMRFRLQSSRKREFAGRPAVELRMRSPDDQVAQVQVYAVSGNRGFVVTLAVKPTLLDRMRVPFEELLAAIRLPP